MKKYILSALVITGLSLSGQDLPMPSPSAEMEQRVGLTDIKIEYSRPGVKDRVVFGELVPYGEVWRTGANKVPSITFSSDVRFGNKNVEAGTYAIFTIPNKDTWTVILNSNTEQWGTSEYDESENVVAVEVMSEEALMTETFTIDINDIRDNSATLVLRWEKTQVKVPLKVEVHPIAVANIEQAIAEKEGSDEAWRVYRNAAGYYYNSKTDMDMALSYVNQSISLYENSWYSYWLKAEILAEQDNYKDAIKAAKESIKVGEKMAKDSESEFGYTEMIQKAIAEWSEKK